MARKKIKELTEHELGLLIYKYAAGCNDDTAKIVYCHKNWKTSTKERSENLANIIFNNKEVEI